MEVEVLRAFVVRLGGQRCVKHRLDQVHLPQLYVVPFLVDEQPSILVHQDVPHDVILLIPFDAS